MKKGLNTESDNSKSFFPNVSSHKAKSVRDTLQALNWEVLPYMAPSDYHLFVSMDHALADQRFGLYEDVKKWFAVKGKYFY